MSNLTCTQLDEILCDYLDGTLDAPGRASVDFHTHTCTACAALLADVQTSVSFLGRVADVEPPKELITRILFHTPQPSGMLQRLSPKGRLRRWLEPVLQPRFAMGMAMTILSFSMLGKFVTPVRQLKPADLDPVKVWRSIDDSMHRTWDKTVKYYDNLRLVYEIQTAIDDIKGDPAEMSNPNQTNPNQNPNQKKSGESK